jgi:hypothetical protein
MANSGQFQPVPLQDRLNARINKTDTCWLWTGKVDKTGYGSFGMRVDQACRTRSAHKIVYETLVGPVPESMQLDHLCKIPLCVNPEHLEIVSPKENIMRSNGLASINAKKTHCKYGHEFTEANTYVPSKRPNRRYCRTCAGMKLKP